MKAPINLALSRLFEPADDPTSRKLRSAYSVANYLQIKQIRYETVRGIGIRPNQLRVNVIPPWQKIQTNR